MRQLEDWDEEDKPLVLYNYPSIQNGSTIHLIVLIKGMHVKNKSRSQVDCSSVSPSKKNLYFDLEKEDFFLILLTLLFLIQKGLP